MRTPVLILPAKGQILGEGVKNGKILRTSFMDGPISKQDLLHLRALFQMEYKLALYLNILLYAQFARRFRSHDREINQNSKMPI